jgi:Putative addiction module component
VLVRYSGVMIALEEIHQMPLHEKMAIMEAIWTDLSAQEEAVEVPQWHQELLDERERLVAEGKANLIDWEVAKKQIKEATE